MAGRPDRQSTRQQEKTGAKCPEALRFAAFYADCEHEVEELVSGHRCVLVYNLTGVPDDAKLLKKRGLHDNEWRAAPFKLCANPPQPADLALIMKIAYEVCADALSPHVGMRASSHAPLL